MGRMLGFGRRGWSWRCGALAGALSAASIVAAGCASGGGEAGSVDVFASREDAVVYCGGASRVEGIDVSYWQGASIDWGRVRASGKRFAFMRVSYGAQAGVDSTFRRNWTESKANGVLRGAYQYFLPAQDTAAQANLVVRELGRLGAGDLPAVIDVEQTPNGVTPAQYAQKVADWIGIVEQGTGKRPIVYTGKYFWNDNVQSSAFAANPLWLAAYVSGCPDTPRPWTKWTFWQFTDSGSVPGISGNVDVNVFDGTVADLEALAGVSACAPTEEVCNGRDDDCDGQSDEDDVCEAAFLERHMGVFAPPSTTDVNGDGLADVCGRGAVGVFCKQRTQGGFEAGPAAIPWSDADGYGAPSVRSTLRLGDVNGDGRADFCIRHPLRGVECRVSTASGSWSEVRGPAWTDASGWGAPRFAFTLRLVDLDGDGRDDLCARAAKGVVCHLSTGAGFGPEIAGPAWSDAAGFVRPRTYGTLAFVDVTGDGARDACIRAPEGVRCAPFLARERRFGAAFEGPAWTDDAGWGDVKYFGSLRFADVDGDGMADACARGVAGLRCALATGAGFGAEILAGVMKDTDGWGLERYGATLRAADIDGDGRADLCARAAAGLRCWGLSAGAFVQTLSSSALSDVDGWGVSSRFETLTFGDADGDGVVDACARGADGFACWPTVRAATAAPETVAEYGDAQGWDEVAYFPSLRFGGPRTKREPPRSDAGVSEGDAGPRAPTDGGTPSGVAPEGGGGCGCRVASRTESNESTAALAATMLSLVTLRRRRRATHSA
jgi:GH25 family lysozyme M1 (1,4-beta-N-acetylmuramidase)